MLCGQASKADQEQPSIASILPPVHTDRRYDVVVVGCGPAGLYLASELATKGLLVALIGTRQSHTHTHTHERHRKPSGSFLARLCHLCPDK